LNGDFDILNADMAKKGERENNHGQFLRRREKKQRGERRDRKEDRREAEKKVSPKKTSPNK
jgi:hypothetical protein